jgi:hypothetical protein
MTIRFDKFRNELNLTQSVLLSNALPREAVEKVLDIQNRLISGFEGDFGRSQVPHMRTVEGLREWERRPSGRRLYVYPAGTIHFSMLNCFRIDLPNDGFRKFKSEYRGSSWFSNVESFNCNALLPALNSKNLAFKVGGIYRDSAPSVALKVYPQDDRLFAELEKSAHRLVTSNEGSAILPQHALRGEKVKAYSDGKKYFAMNITAKVVLVVSDAYLSNENPEVECEIKTQ